MQWQPGAGCWVSVRELARILYGAPRSDSRLATSRPPARQPASPLASQLEQSQSDQAHLPIDMCRHAEVAGMQARGHPDQTVLMQTLPTSTHHPHWYTAGTRAGQQRC